jgi:DNA-binding transcriptional ArsR family regulator
MSNLELAQATGLQPSTVNYHVQRLAQAGLVAALRDGRNVRLHPGARAGSADPAPAAAGAA